jgi:6-pyruvoyltetrahydropterin/6-carboxytetrahydropterin synthase
MRFDLSFSIIMRIFADDKKKNRVLATSIKTRNMYYVKKQLEISAAHSLKLTYQSKCECLHGHNWIITVYCKSKNLDENGMVVDFTKIKQAVTEKLDHKNLNDVLPFNPSAENIAHWVCEQIPHCYRVEVIESADNTAIYEKD